MDDFVFFLKTCLAAKTLIASFCGLLVVPFVTWLAVRLLEPLIRGMENDAPWQAPLAAIASATPGATFLLLAVVDLQGAYSSGCLQFIWGRALFGSILGFAILAFVRAMVIAYQRNEEVRRLVRHSDDAPERVENIARKVGIDVRVVHSAHAFCALAQPLNPLVLISVAALECLSNDELEAALRHEQAHALRHDLGLAAALSFFSDLLPLPVHSLTETYNAAREMAADERAIQTVEPHKLASAILILAGNRNIGHGVAALAEDTRSLKRRIVTLLEDRAERRNVLRSRIVVLAALLTVSAFSITPAVLSATNYYTCTFTRMSV